MSESSPTVTSQDVDALVTGATPQFSQQIRARVRALVAGLAEGDPVREYAELQVAVLDRLAMGTTRSTRAIGVPDVDAPGWAAMPSHPKGGIAPGASGGDGH